MYDSTTEQFVKIIVQISLNVLAILVNLCLLFVFWKNPLKRFRNTPSYTIANLALADIVAAVGGLGGNYAIFTSSSDLKTHKFWGVIATAGQQSSFLLVATLAFDRYVAITHPYQYRLWFTQRKLGVVLNVLAWVIAWVISPLTYIDILIIVKLYVANIAILTSITLILYPLNYISFTKARKKLSANAGEFQQRTLEDLLLAQQLNQTWMLVSTFLVVVTTPYVYFLAIAINCPRRCLFDPVFIKFWSYYKVVFPIILLINPFIYALRLPLYRKSFNKIFLNWCTKLKCLKRTTKDISTENITDNLLCSSTQNRIPRSPNVNIAQSDGRRQICTDLKCLNETNDISTTSLKEGATEDVSMSNTDSLLCSSTQNKIQLSPIDVTDVSISTQS